jgi:tight adherence protein B
MNLRRYALAAAIVVATVWPAVAAAEVTVTPVGRVPFPYRGFVLDLPQKTTLSSVHPIVLENGVPVGETTLTPVGSSNVRFGTILAIDASNSMAGEPYRAALGAARVFIERRARNEQVGVVMFNSAVNFVQPLSATDASLRASLNNRPALAYGTHIYDALKRSLQALEDAHIAAASIVLLSDGADVGSKARLDSILDRAQRDHVRIFTVGLRSTAFEAGPLQALANGTGARYAEAASTPALAQIYSDLSGRLANEYLLQYRSGAKPGTHVVVNIRLVGFGTSGASYTAPTPSGLKPFHRSLVSRFLLSGASAVLIGLLSAALVGWVLYTLLTKPRNGLISRVGEFVDVQATAATPTEDHPVPTRRESRRKRSAGSVQRLLSRLESEFEIGEISISPAGFVLGTMVATIIALFILGAIAVPLALLALLVPLFARAWVLRKVKHVRDSFADQLPETLQLLASALRSGHSLIGALRLVVDQAPEPIRREFGQVLTDDQLGLPLERALRNVAVRMKSKDMRQVGMIGELQRTAGGNAAEVLDTVVATVRERADVRRLAQTLTAQGRMARWILSLMPVALGLFMLGAAPQLMKPMLLSTGGQVALVFAALLVFAGSAWIKQIVNIEV